MMLIKHKNKIPQDAEEMHLCYLGEEGYQAQHSKIFKKLSSYPRFMCKNCGRIAHDSKNLCTPEKIDDT